MELRPGTEEGVTSLNGLTGDVILAAGANITITPVGNTLTIASTGGGGTPGGSNTQVQFNDTGSFGGASALVYDKTKGITASQNALFVSNGPIDLSQTTISGIDPNGQTILSSNFTDFDFSDYAFGYDLMDSVLAITGGTFTDVESIRGSDLSVYITDAATEGGIIGSVIGSNAYGTTTGTYLEGLEISTTTSLTGNTVPTIYQLAIGSHGYDALPTTLYSLWIGDQAGRASTVYAIYYGDGKFTVDGDGNTQTPNLFFPEGGTINWDSGDVVITQTGNDLAFTGASTYRFDGQISTTNSIALEDPGAGTFTIAIQAPTLAAGYTLTLPVDDGSSGEVLSTNGSGVLSWIASGGSSYWAAGTDPDDIYNTNTGNVGIGTPDPISRLTITSFGTPGDYTAANSGIFIINSDGDEVMRIWASDPDVINNYNSGNLYVGFEAGLNQPSDNSSAGYYNIGIGFRALASITEGSDNVAIGKDVLSSLTGGYSNTGIGSNTMGSLTTGHTNVAIGKDSLKLLESGNYNMAIGEVSLTRLVSGIGNAAIGDHALSGATTGSANIGIGSNTGDQITDGSNNTIIGSNANTTSGSLSNSFAIGYTATVVATNTGVIGNADVTDVYFGSTSGLANVHAANFVMTGSSLRTDTVDTHQGFIQAYDVDGTAYVTFATLTNGNTPTFSLASAVTGVTQSAGNNSTKLATTAYVDTADGAFATKALGNLASVAINAALVLATNDAFALGSATKSWADLFLAEGGVINWDNGDATLTQVGDVVTLAGAGLVVTEIVGGSALTLTGATQTSSFPVITATQTWNNSGTTFNGIKLNVTNTASAAASLLLDFQLSTVSKFAVGVTSALLVGVDAANTTVLRNGTTAQTVNFYKTFTDASNYERLAFAVSSNIFTITPEFAGTGIGRGLQLIRSNGSISLSLSGGASPNTGITIESSNGVTATSFVRVDIAGGGTFGAASGSNTDMRFTGGFTRGSTSSAIYTTLSLSPTINYFAGSSGSYNGLLIGITETSLPTGPNYLILAKAGSTAATTEFSVLNNGDIFTAGAIELGAATDTTLARVSAGVVSIEGVTIGTASNTLTLTNKRITKRVVTAADATSVTPNSDNADITYQSNSQALGTLTINADAGTPTNGQEWTFKIKSTNVQTFSWNAVYVGGTVALPTVTTGGGKIDYYNFIYDTVNSKWDYIPGGLGF